MKKKYSRLRELWAVPKYKILIKLGGWAIFFIIFFTLVAIGNYKESHNQESDSVDYKEAKENLISNNLAITYTLTSINFNELYIEGTLIDNVLSGTREQDSLITRFKIENNIAYEINTDVQTENDTLFSGINLQYFYPSYVMDLLDENDSLKKVSDDKKVYSYTIDGASYSIYITNNDISKIIILDNNITYELNYTVL